MNRILTIKEFVEGDPYRGLARKKPHLMPMLGQWVCFLLTPTGQIVTIGSGMTYDRAYMKMGCL